MIAFVKVVICLFKFVTLTIGLCTKLDLQPVICVFFTLSVSILINMPVICTIKC